MSTARPAERVCVVIPCFNESRRLPIDALEALLDDPDVSLCLVDDGSTDGTLALLHSIAARLPRVGVLALPANAGKGEATRAGLRRAIEHGARVVAYADADFSTPSGELLRLLRLIRDRSDLDVVMASRVALIGRDIRRSPFRHYTGRLFATLASVVLGAPFYDTQCGAKVFRSTELLSLALERPFRSRWAFDVELLSRLQRAGVARDAFWEEPLLVWHDRDQSHRSVRSSVRSTFDLVPIWRDGR